MATLISNSGSTQLMSGVATFAATEIGTSAQALIRANTTTIATATTATTPTFTVTNTKVIDGVLLWLFLSSGTAGTGTFKVDLQKGGVSQASVTVNKSDLPDANNAVPAAAFFKFTSTATGDGGANWTIVITTTSGTGSGVITYNRNSATSGDMTRTLRTTTAATLAAGDNFAIVGDLTGAGTKTDRTVTMNSTAATDYGNGTVNTTAAYGGLLAVGMWGTLNYGNTAATNYLMRLSGDLIVYQNGTFNMGSSGAEIPRDGSAVLEFDPASADGDFGLRNQNGTVNIYGLSRTVAKSVVKCKLTADSSVNLLQAIALSSTALTAATALTTVDPTGTSLGAGSTAGTFNQLIGSTDTAANSNHKYTWTYGSTVAGNTTQVYTQWVKRGSGTNNRFIRLQLATATTLPATNGFYADFDLQAGTVGTCTVLGNGTATSASITAFGGGFICKIIGRISSASAAPIACIGACSASTTVSYAGDATQNFIINWPQVYTAASQPTQDTVDTDTGWLSGDVVALATTTRTANECEVATLGSNAGASTLTYSLYPVNARSGTSPTQAEVGLLTRNVKIRSTSTTLMAYVYCTALSAFTVQWAQFYYLGVSGTSNKRGIEIDGGAVATAKSITFCSVHDCEANGVYLQGTAGVVSMNVTFSNNVMWNCATIGGMVTVSGQITNTDWTASSNLLIKNVGGFNLADIGGTCTNNIVVGMSASGNYGFQLAEGAAALTPLGTFSGNVAHSGLGHGLIVNSQWAAGTIDAFISYRNAQSGVSLAAGINLLSDLIFNSPILFGNVTGISATSGDFITITGTGIIAGDTSFACTNGLALSTTLPQVLDISSIDFSGTTSIYAPNATTDILCSVVASSVFGTVNNCKFGVGNNLSKTVWTEKSYISFEKYNQTAGDHRTDMKYGQVKTDTSFFNSASPSMRMTPSSASLKLESAPKGKGLLVPVSSGNPASISIMLYKSKAGDGAAYNGNQPRLIQRANPALGQNSDVVLGTYGSSTGSWNALSANTSTPTDDGAFEIIVDCDGTAGWINVDDLQAA